jgi:alkylhydroperoxidase family enzyme
MLEYVVQLSKDANEISADDHKRLRGVGFDDRAILQITLIAAWFNYVNRVADALGVGRSTVASTKSKQRPGRRPGRKI